MKKASLILAAIVLAGCTLDRQNDFDTDLALSFQPAMYMHVSAEDSDRYPAEQSFGVRIWSLPDDCLWREDSLDAEDFLPLTEATPKTDKVWAFAEETMWPSKHRLLTFMAYSPFDADGRCDVGKGVSFQGVDVVQDQTDLLYTDSIADVEKLDCGGVVTVPFKHALSCIDFRVKNRVKTSEEIIIRRIEVEGVRFKGDFSSMAKPQWKLLDEESSFVFFEGSYETEHLPSDIGRKWLMMPQTLDTQVIVEYDFVTEAQTSITQTLRTVPLRTTLESGRSYTFTLSVGIDDVKFLTEIVEDRFK